MLAFVIEDLNNCYPFLIKMGEKHKQDAETVFTEVNDFAAKCQNAYQLCSFYRDNKELQKKIKALLNTDSAVAIEFATHIEWLLTKGAYFYSDD